jgi:hypothetical protein
LWSQQFGYIQRYSITKYHSLLIVFESIVSTARGSGASRLLAINVRASYAAVMFCCSSPRSWPASPGREVQNKYDAEVKVR